MMGRRVWVRLAAMVALMLVVGACSGGEATPSDGDDTTTSTAAASSGDTVASEDTTTTTEAGSEPAATPPDAGSATLIIGDQTWTFDNYYCAFGPEETGNERVSFSSGSIGSPDGVRLQLDASIQDVDKQGRYEGEGTIQSVTLNDIEDFENPSVDFGAVEGIVGASSFVIQVDGNTVTVEASFDDGTTDERESIPGTLEATCGGR